MQLLDAHVSGHFWTVDYHLVLDDAVGSREVESDRSGYFEKFLLCRGLQHDADADAHVVCVDEPIDP